MFPPVDLWFGSDAEHELGCYMQQSFIISSFNSLKLIHSVKMTHTYNTTQRNVMQHNTTQHKTTHGIFRIDTTWHKEQSGTEMYGIENGGHWFWPSSSF